MLSDEEDSDNVRMFTLHQVNSYGNAQIEPIDNDADTNPVSLTPKTYLSLDWHPKARAKFFDKERSEDFNQDDSFHGKVAPKVQVK